MAYTLFELMSVTSLVHVYPGGNGKLAFSLRL